MRTCRLVLLGAIVLLPASGQGIAVAPDDLPWAVVDQPYAVQLTSRTGIRCPVAETSFAVEGLLPAGLSISVIGQIEGVPRKTGIYRFGIRASNGCSASVKPMTLVVTGAPILSVSANALEFRYRAGGLIPESQMIRVTGTWPDRPYTIDSRNAAWVRALPKLWKTPRPDSGFEADSVEVSVDPGTLDPGVYETKLVFSTWQGVNAPAVKVRLVIQP